MAAAAPSEDTTQRPSAIFCSHLVGPLRPALRAITVAYADAALQIAASAKELHQPHYSSLRDSLGPDQAAVSVGSLTGAAALFYAQYDTLCRGLQPAYYARLVAVSEEESENQPETAIMSNLEAQISNAAVYCLIRLQEDLKAVEEATDELIERHRRRS